MLVYFDFSMPSKELWNKPLLRVFGSKPVLQKQNGVNFLSITFATYFSRLIFYLIAYTPLAFVMNHLDPVKLVDVPLTTLPAFSPSFVSESRHELDKFSLAGFLAAHENPGYRVAEQPPGLALELKAYQLQTLAWMQDHEEMPGMGLNSLFWEERSFLDEGKFYYFPAAGELRLEKPPTVFGGILAEEMGLGKTLEIVALIALEKHRYRDDLERLLPEVKDGSMVPSGATLVVAPVTLVSQWIDEIKKSSGGSITCVAYTSDNAIQSSIRSPSARMAAIRALVNGFDIVVTSYIMLAKEKNLKTLLNVHWRRIVLDEMQEIRSSTTELARMCAQARANRRWMVSGTPLYTSISDLNGELNFLGVQPFCLSDSTDGFWGRRIQAPWQVKDESALDLLNVLLDGVMMRHSKSQKTLSGQSILELPSVQLYYVPISWQGSLGSSDASSTANDVAQGTRYVCAFLERLACDYYERLAQNDPHSVHNPEMATTPTTLLRMTRMACISAVLINGGMGAKSVVHELNALVRANDYFSHWAPAVSECAMDDELRILTRLSGDDALRILTTQQLERAGPAGVKRGAPAGGASARAFAQETVLERVARLTEEVNDLEEMMRRSNCRSWCFINLLQVERRLEYKFDQPLDLPSSENSFSPDPLIVTLIVDKADAKYCPAALRFGLERQVNASTVSLLNTQGVEVLLTPSQWTELANISEPLEKLKYEIRLSKDSLAKLRRPAKEAEEPVKAANKKVREWEGKLRAKEKFDNSKIKDKKQREKSSKLSVEYIKEVLAGMHSERESSQRAYDNCVNAAASEIERLKAKLEVDEKLQEECRMSIKQAFQLWEQAHGKLMYRTHQLRPLPLLRWHLAVEKITSGRTLLPGLSTRFWKRVFAMVQQIHFVEAQQRLLVRRTALAETLGHKELKNLAQAESLDEFERFAAAQDLIGPGQSDSEDEELPGHSRAAKFCVASRDDRRADGLDDEADVKDDAGWERRNDLKNLLAPYKSELVMRTQSLRRMPGGVRVTTASPCNLAFSRFPPGRMEALQLEMEKVLVATARAKAKLEDSRPYLAVLQRVGERADLANLTIANSLQQTGFQVLNDLLEGKETACGICLETVKHPTFTRCVHVFCGSCILAATRYAQSNNNQGLAPNQAPCPCCRQPYRVADLILVQVAPRANHSSSGSSGQSSRLFAPSAPSAPHVDLSQCRYHPSLSLEEMTALEPAVGFQVGRSAEFPSLPPRLVTELARGCGRLPLNSRQKLSVSVDEEKPEGPAAHARVWSPKLQALLAEVCRVVPANCRKIVVFSQFASALAHASHMLSVEGIAHVSIFKDSHKVGKAGETAPSIASAVRTFSCDPACVVFLLQASAAAVSLFPT